MLSYFILVELFAQLKIGVELLKLTVNVIFCSSSINITYSHVCLSFSIAGRSKFGSFLSLGHDHTKLDRLYMRGPEGRGEVEVAVSGIAGLLSLASEYFFLSVHCTCLKKSLLELL